MRLAYDALGAVCTLALVAACAIPREALAQVAPSAPAAADQPAPTAPGFGGDMTAGGLAPPPPIDTGKPAESATERQLDEAKEKDSGRGLSWFWVDAQAGYQHVGLRTFSSADYIEGFSTTANGGVIAPGLGARLLFFTVGARANFGFFESWDLFTVGGEIGMRIQKGRFEPHLDIGGGYAALGSFKEQRDAHINGFYVRIGGGLDYFVTPIVSVGGALNFELLHLGSPAIDSGLNVGSSNGLGVSVTGGAGLHF